MHAIADSHIQLTKVEITQKRVKPATVLMMRAFIKIDRKLPQAILFLT